MAIDPEAVRRERAETDVVVAEISRKTLKLDEALRARSIETLSGTITVTFDADAVGQVLRRTRVSRVEIKGKDGQSETQTHTETVSRHQTMGP